MIASHPCRHARSSRAGAVSFALLIALGLSLTRPPPVEAQWKPDWNVKCTWDHSQKMLKRLAALQLALKVIFGDQLPADLPDQLM